MYTAPTSIHQEPKPRPCWKFLDPGNLPTAIPPDSSWCPEEGTMEKGAMPKPVFPMGPELCFQNLLTCSQGKNHLTVQSTLRCHVRGHGDNSLQVIKCSHTSQWSTHGGLEAEPSPACFCTDSELRMVWGKASPECPCVWKRYEGPMSRFVRHQGPHPLLTHGLRLLLYYPAEPKSCAQPEIPAFWLFL